MVAQIFVGPVGNHNFIHGLKTVLVLWLLLESGEGIEVRLLVVRARILVVMVLLATKGNLSERQLVAALRVGIVVVHIVVVGSAAIVVELLVRVIAGHEWCAAGIPVAVV